MCKNTVERGRPHVTIWRIACWIPKAKGRIAQSVWRLATGWTVRGPNPRVCNIFRTCPDRPWGPPSLLYYEYRIFLGGKERPGRDADPSLPSSAVLKKEYNYTSTPPIGRTACTQSQCLYKVHFTCFLPKPTDTHSEYVILIAFAF